jgi:predicted nucleotidyltransferase
MAERRPDVAPELLGAFRRSIRARIARALEAEQALAQQLAETVLPLVRAVVAQARQKGLCSGAWVIGSFAWGQPHAESDVDVVVDGCADPDGLAAELARACRRDVHIVPWQDASEELKERTLADGVEL